MRGNAELRSVSGTRDLRRRVAGRCERVRLHENDLRHRRRDLRKPVGWLWRDAELWDVSVSGHLRRRGSGESMRLRWNSRRVAGMSRAGLRRLHGKGRGLSPLLRESPGLRAELHVPVAVLHLQLGLPHARRRGCLQRNRRSVERLSRDWMLRLHRAGFGLSLLLPAPHGVHIELDVPVAILSVQQ
jgi:hypothetical protein